MEPAAAKRRLREQFQARRRGVDAATAMAAARAVAGHVLACAELAAAGRVALYAALPDELPTRPLLGALLERGRRPLLPRMTRDRRLEFAGARGFRDLRPGPHGVLEPPPEVPAETLGTGDLVLVPGVAFDRLGHRLGRGAGYYDRTFPPGGSGQPLLFGLAYAWQLVDALPQGPHDRAMDGVVTERGVRRVREAGR